MPTTSVASLISISSPATTATIQQPVAELGSLTPGLHSLQLETSMSFSLVFATLVVGLVLVRHALAKSRSGPFDNLA